MSALIEIASFGYHDVADDPTTSGFQRPLAWPYKQSWAAFRGHLDAVAASGWRPPPVVQLDFRRAARHLLLTFDDGGASAVAVGDELCRRGWCGHFFIVTSLIGQRAFLSAGDITYLRSCGHVVGSHSHTHPDIFRRQSPVQMAGEWRRSCNTLADLLGEPCVAASLPGGDLSPAVLDSAPRAGLKYLFTSEPVLEPQLHRGCWIIGRCHVKAGTTPDELRSLARFQGWRRALWARRLKGLARSLCPPLYAQYVRRMTRPEAGPARRSEAR